MGEGYYNLKPCYHCGKDKGYIEKSGIYTYIKCDNCSAAGAFEKDKNTAVRLWDNQYMDSTYENANKIIGVKETPKEELNDKV